ncbi:MAG: hypothetical protein ACYCYO_00025 [Bacilli bacterium]
MFSLERDGDDKDFAERVTELLEIDSDGDGDSDEEDGDDWWSAVYQERSDYEHDLERNLDRMTSDYYG